MLKRVLYIVLFAAGVLQAAQSASIVVSDVGGVYPPGQTAAKDGDTVRIIATVSPFNVDSVWAIATSIIDTQVYAGDPDHVLMYDDGAHDDGLSSDGVYASDWLPVKGKTAYNRVVVFAAKDTIWNVGVGTVGIDNFYPFIGASEVLYPAGQSAAKNGDEVRVRTYMDDVSSYVDVSLMIDNSGSMKDTASGDTISKLQAAQLAADTFLAQLGDSDRADLWTFYGGAGWTTSEETLKVALTYNKQEIIDSVNALVADQWTPLYDATVEAVRYVDSVSNRIAAAIILTDGDDAGPGGGSGSNEYTRTDCYYLPIPVFTIGFGDTADIDTAFLDSVALTSGGKFYIAPNAAQLDSIYREIQTIIAKIKSPKGISKAWMNGQPVGADTMIVYFDDGDHDDYMYQDSMWGTSLFTVNTSIFSDSVFLNIKALDVAYNERTSGVYIKIDNILPIADTLHVTYPSGKNVVHNGEKVYFTINVIDTGTISGISEVYLDATQIGGSSHVVMRDDGTGNDAVAGDNIYTSDSIEVNTDTYSGTAAVYACAVDIAGNTVVSAGGVVVDNIPPTITDIRVIYPDGQTAVKQGDTIIISAEITDDISGVDSVLIDLTGITGGVFTMVDDGTGYDENAGDNVYTYWGVVTATSTSQEGFTITAYDNEGNAGSVNGNVTLDNTPPNSAFSLVNLDPDNIYRNGEYVHIRVINAGETGLTVKADFSTIDSYYIPGSETWTDNGDSTYDIVYRISDNNTRADGQYLVPVTLYDGALNSASHNIILYLDNSGASVDTLYLSDADNIIGANDTIHAVLSDEKGVIQAEFFVDAIPGNGQGVTMTLDNPGARSVNATGILDIDNLKYLADGRHKVFVHGVDSTGIWGPFASLEFVVDREAPVIENVTVVYPDGKNVVKDGDEVKIKAHIVDNTSGINLLWLDGTNLNGNANIAMYDDGTNGDDVAGDNVYTALVTVSTGGANGNISFDIHATDVVPNENTISSYVVVDNTPPGTLTITVLDPDNIYRNGEEVHLRVSTDSPGYSISAYFGNIDSGYLSGAETVQDNTDGTYDVTYRITETNTVVDGGYYVNVVATDEAGNSVEDSILLYLDNSGPVVSGLDFAIDPLNDNILNAPDTVIGIATDDKGIKGVEYFIDNTGNDGSGTIMVLDNPGNDSVNLSAYFNIYTLSEGLHTIYVHAQDSTGIWGDYASMEFVVDTTPPTIDKVTVIYPEGQTEARAGQRVKITALVKDRVTEVDPATVILNAVNINGDSAVLMVDDGTNGDDVAGDNVYTAAIEVTSTQTGTFNFSIKASDIVPNTNEVSGSIIFDNSAPYLEVSYSPEPKSEGEVYQSRILITVATHDTPVNTNLKAVVFDVYNEAGDIVYHKDINKLPEELRFKDEVPLIAGLNRIVIKSVDHVGNVTTYEDTINYIIPEASDVVGPEGDTVKAPDGTMLIIPEGALLENTEIKIKTIPPSLLPPPLDTSVVIIKAGHEITPHGIDFHVPVTLVLPYTTYDLDPDHDGVMNYSPDSLTVFYYDSNDWVKVGESEIDTAAKTVSVTINHLSTFALGIDRRLPPTSVLVYLTRNPFRLSEGTTIVYQLPAPGKITVKIYDLSGDLIRTLVEDLKVQRSGEYSIKWYGGSDNNRFHGSGLYIYVLEYESDDGAYREVVKKPIGIIK